MCTGKRQTNESESLLRMSMVELGPWPLGQVESAFWICLLKSLSRCFTRYCFLHSASACICHASHGKACAYLNCTEFSILIWSGKIPRKSWDILSFYWSLPSLAVSTRRHVRAHSRCTSAFSVSRESFSPLDFSLFCLRKALWRYLLYDCILFFYSGVAFCNK